MGRPFVGKHRHGPHPLAADRPAGLDRPELAGNRVDPAIVTIGAGTAAGRMAMAAETLGFRLGPGKGAHIFRVGRAVAVAVNVIAPVIKQVNQAVAA